MLFILKKLVSRLLFPLPFSLGLAVVGLGLLWFTRRQRAGKVLVTLGVLLLLLLSTGAVSGQLIAPLEARHPPYGLHDTYPVPESEVRYVVVLAGGYPAVEGYPITRQADGGGMARLVEGVRVYRRCPNSTLILSGGRGADPNLDPGTLTNMLFVKLLGVDEARVVVRNVSRDTEDEARNLAEIIGTAPMVLVATAAHMPRALAIFEAQGMRAIAAPTDYRTGLVHVFIVESLYPNADALYNSERAIYEALGTLWLKVSSALQAR
jgi:uncharacterized SAM-binding protein YcdF (DUF218 family)